MDSAVATLHATVHGRVQGVGFRQFVQYQARSNNLSGWVRNRPDGQTVELMTEGPREDLDRFLTSVREGPPGSRVDEIDVVWSDASDLPNPFQIRT
jgi:acylphosphatase